MIGWIVLSVLAAAMTNPPCHPWQGSGVLKGSLRRGVSEFRGLVDFAIGLVNSALNLPNGQVKFYEKIKLQKNGEINSCSSKCFWGRLK